MDEAFPPDTAQAEYRRRRAERPAPRPDRFALWAVVMGVIAMIAGVATADAAGGGGVDTGGGGERQGCVDANFGSRTLSQGDCGDDVKTLNWILKGKLGGVRLHADYDGATTDTVRSFERSRDLNVDGVVERGTRRALVRSLPKQFATWYGPGFFGNQTACGQTLTRRTRGVAHRRLPCGTKVVVGYRGHFARATVIDRGPYANGARWDLTRKTARQVNFETSANIRVAKIR